MALLRHPPPALINPTIVSLGTGLHTATYADDEDVVFIMPGTPRTRILTTTGGRNIQIIGGAHIQGSSSDNVGMRFNGCTGSIFLEGIDLDMNGHTADGIDAGGDGSSPWADQPDLYIQNCYLHGMTGTFADSTHADAYQPQAAVGNIYMDKVTAQSGYQGFFISAQKPINSATISRVNTSYPASAANGYQWWFIDGGAGTGPFGLPKTNPYPTILDQVYADPGTSGRDFITQLIWPKPGTVDGSGNPIGALTNDAGATAYWPALTQITGVVTQGAPLGGNFVASDAGIGYVSPGYVSVSPSIAGLGGRQQISRCL